MLTRDWGVSSRAFPAETFTTLERQLVLRSDVPEVLEYLRTAYRRLHISSTLHSQSCNADAVDDGEILGIERDPWLSFNGEPVDYREDVTNTNFRRAFYGASKLFRLSFRRNPNWHSLYGVALRIRDRAIIVSAQSGIGKTTLALELLARGAGFYSDEFAFIRKSDYAVSGLPRALLIRERTLRVFCDERLAAVCAAATPRSPHGDKVWDTIDAGAVFGEQVFAQPAPLAAAIVLERSTTQTSVAPISSALAATEFTKRLNVDAEGFERLTNAAQMLAAVPCYRLAAHSLQAGADAVEALLA